MNRRLMATLVIAASMFAGEAMYAAPAALHMPVHAMFGDAGTVKLSLRNDTKQTITVKAGDTVMTLQPGKPVPVKLHDGDKIVAEEGSPTIAPGTVLTVVSPNLSGATIRIK